MADKEHGVSDTQDMSDEPGPPGEEEEYFKKKEEPHELEEDKQTSQNEDNKEADTGSNEDSSSKPDFSKLSRLERSLLNNMTYEEEVTLRKNTSIGAILSGLSTGSYGTKAKENIVKVEVPGGEKRRHDDGYGFRSGYGTGYGSGYGSGYNKKFHGGWDMNSMWNTWGGEEEYVEEEAEGPSASQSNEEWIAEEMKFLEEEYGEGIISIIDDEEEGLIYVCEICQVHLNAKKSLDSHMNGMKHLKKKNFWEKKRRQAFFTDVNAIAEGAKPEDKSEEDTKKSPKGSVKKPSEGDNRLTQNCQEGSTYLQGPPPSLTGDLGFLNHPPPGYGVLPSASANNAPRGNWGTINTAAPPPPKITNIEPPPAPAIPKPKSNLAGGPTGTLLQKLAACAVKSFKDSDLATNVVIALVKTLKEYNHGKGDTNAIEVLTEMDVKLRGLKAQMANMSADSKPSNTSKAKVPDAPKKIEISYSSHEVKATNDGGTWYSQGDPGVTASQQPSPDSGAVHSSSKNVAYGSTRSNTSGYSIPSSGYALSPTTTSKPPPAQTGNYSTSYPTYDASSHAQMASTTTSAYGYSSYSTSTKDNYYSQKSDNNSYSSYQGQGTSQSAVMDIIQSTTAPPPPPPPENANTTGYSAPGLQGGYPAYFTQPPPPQGL